MNVAFAKPMTLAEFLEWEDQQELRYEYETQPNIFDPTARHHLGFCVLEMRDRTELDGYYYTLDGTSAKGGIRLQRGEAPPTPAGVAARA